MSQVVYTFLVGEAEERSERSQDIEAATALPQGKCRLDTFLAAQEPVSCSRSQIRKLIRDGDVKVNDRSVKPGYWIKRADTIVLTLPEPRPSELIAEPIPLDILFEDEHLLVINKPAGMVVHPAPGHYTGTLVHALLYHCRELSGIGGVQRPGIVHRLDRDTSGAMLVAKTDDAHIGLSAQLQTRSLTRVYAAVVHGRVKELHGQVEMPIGRHRSDRKKMAIDPEKGRYALSLYRVVQQFPHHALLHVTLQTGRTHQIRVHLKYLHHPVVGDPVYGNGSYHNFQMSRQALHAQTIAFFHPVSKERMTFTTALPDDMQHVVDILSR
ncbi:RNA pseudouridine synthase [candidate division KSB3 bacterium]|uniref:Pseudouridine synthase n=1 Tax=candidate division KSB3 bacterium TaxID=2044937 RepID=A0A2G6KK90_9BACT|nr:MAG: RNA pseudouridine synthase [candidate division KSB3 bacterium]